MADDDVTGRFEQAIPGDDEFVAGPLDETSEADDDDDDDDAEFEDDEEGDESAADDGADDAVEE